MAVMSGTAQTTDYLSDKMKHCFWKESSDKVCDDEEDLQGKIVVVTGSNTGIGKMIALELAKRKARVIMAVRDQKKGEAALDDIRKRVGAGVDVDVTIMKLDLGDLQSVRDFVMEFEAKYDRLDVLVNNAGFMDTNGIALQTKDGFEQHVGVNHLGPFLLTKLMIPSLQKAAPSRIVCVASSNIALVPLNPDDLLVSDTVHTGDSGKEQYSVSKLLNAVCMAKLASGLEKTEIMLFQLCPGFVNSDVFRNETGCLKKLRNSVSMTVAGLTPHQGAETAVYLTVSKSVPGPPEAGKGEIYRFMKLWQRGNVILSEHVKSHNADILYKMSEELVGLREKDLTIKKT